MTGPEGHDATGGQGSGADVGSVGEEAVKLLHAVQDWAKDSGSDYAGATASAAQGVASTLSDLNAHIATGGDDCVYCPACRVISAVRQTSPEVKAHLRSAASSLVQAAAGVLATPVPEPADRPVEKIDVSDDDEDWEDD